MNEQTNFDADYRVLHLTGNPDWATTRKHYKKLVLIWHPDKYSSRPREIEHAKRMFIEITTSYNRIKEFHLKNNRMPSTVALSANTTHAERPHAENAKRTAATRVSNADLGNDTLSRDKSKIDARLVKKSPLKKILWICVACVALFSTVVLFVMLDKKAAQKNAAIASQALREAPKSDFTPSASEIRRSGSKGAFIGNDF